MKLKERYFTVLDSLPDHVFIFSESGIYVDVYGGEENATGFDCKPFIGLSLYDVAPPAMAQEFHSYILAALNTNQTQTVTYKFDEQGVIDLPEHVPIPQEIWFEGIIKPLPLTENGERTVVWMAKNITQRHLLEQRLKNLSEIDDLTGVANRRSFTHSLTEALKEYHLFNRIFSVLMFDIDRFKRVNDSLGHSCGDTAIQHVTKVLNSELRESDCFGRIGGEEFAVILHDTELENANIIAEKLRITLEKKPFTVNEIEIELTISIGITQVLRTDGDIKTLLSRADKAMYHSKNTGRNKVSRYSHSCEPG